jgi:hypothetical protein
VTKNATPTTRDDVVAPELAAFRAAVETTRGTDTVNVSSADPFVTGPCPAWCAYDGNHAVEPHPGRRMHESDDITVPAENLIGINDGPFQGDVTLGHYTVHLRADAGSRVRLPDIVVERHTANADRTRMDTMPVAQYLSPRTARALATALLAAADLAAGPDEWSDEPIDLTPTDTNR